MEKTVANPQSRFGRVLYRSAMLGSFLLLATGVLGWVAAQFVTVTYYRPVPGYVDLSSMTEGQVNYIVFLEPNCIQLSWGHTETDYGVGLRFHPRRPWKLDREYLVPQFWHSKYGGIVWIPYWVLIVCGMPLTLRWLYLRRIRKSRGFPIKEFSPPSTT